MEVASQQNRTPSPGSIMFTRRSHPPDIEIGGARYWERSDGVNRKGADGGGRGNRLLSPSAYCPSPIA